ncbi:hypothetical protein CCUS01_13171 [Colletotrichum cuscutae]|uniref:Uncharacterized protein n=1 Tax=Colletotrichum cuscutae TaxID=1209917 RepID=A0AAJ0DPG1_9PEZI|nr:hypothetical protein CCUS01_13171 [Colletotrichum cuscutae]
MESHHQSTTTTTVYRTLPHTDLFAETVGLPGLKLTEAALEQREPDQTAFLSGPAYYTVLRTEAAVHPFAVGRLLTVLLLSRTSADWQSAGV